jgi:hypothetical protein
VNIDDLKRNFSVSSEAVKAVRKAEELTGKPIHFEIINDLMSDGMLKAARSFMDHHLIYLKQGSMDNINHIIIHECHHIFRFWSVSENERLIMTYNPSSEIRTNEKWKKELGSRSRNYPEQVFKHWYKGLNMFLYNAITDSRIELDIFRDYPENRYDQRQYLKTLEDTTKLTLGNEVKKLSPPSLFLITGAMNQAFLTLLSPIIGKTWKRAFKGETEILKLGLSLFEMVPKEDKGLTQDIQLINKWANRIGIEINWTDFKNVPSNYEYQY